MKMGSIIKFHLSLRLPRAVKGFKMASLTYRGIVVAARKAIAATFAGRNQEEILDLVVNSARDSAKKAAAENEQLGIDSPGSRDGKIVVRKPGGEITTPQP